MRGQKNLLLHTHKKEKYFSHCIFVMAPRKKCTVVQAKNPMVQDHRGMFRAVIV